MAFDARAGKIRPLDLTRRPGDNRKDAYPVGSGLFTWRRRFERLRMECEEIHAHCWRQMEMIAEQREFIRGLSLHRMAAPVEGAGAEGRPEGEGHAGE